MDVGRMVRLGSFAALIGAMVGIPGDLYHYTLHDRSELFDTPLYRAHGVLIITAFALLLLALIGFALHGGERIGTLGLVGFVLALCGTPLVIGDVWAEVVVSPGVAASQPQLLDEDASGFHLAAVIVAFAIFALGWLLFAVAALRSGRFAKPPAILLAVGAVIGFLPLAGAYIVLMLAAGWMGGSLLASDRWQR